MLTWKMARVSAVALVGIMCVVATEARAIVVEPPPGPLALALTAPLSCTALLPNESSVLVETVPGGDSLTFPHNVPCPTGEGTCSEYNYKFTSSSGFNLTNSWLSVSSDVTIHAASPSGSVIIGECLADRTPTNGSTSCAQREVRFGSHASPLEATIIVSGSTPRVSTAAAFNSYGQSGFCLIQGPGVQANPFTPFATTSNQQAAGGKCDVIVTNGANGRPVKIVTTTEGCAVASQVDLTVNGLPFQDSAGEPITFGTGTSTCYATTPKPTCVCRNPATPCPNNF